MPVSPRFLNNGDTVLIVATARSITPAELNPVAGILEGWGFIVETGPNIFKTDHQFAGTDTERASDLQWALDHPSAAAVFIARGGYGSVRIIDRVRYNGFEKHPKWICGFSDVTVLHSHLHRLGYCSIHSAMPYTFLRDRDSTVAIRDLLTGKKTNFEMPPHELNRTGVTEGEFIGGNLSVLYSIAGSASDMQFRNKILFLEDLDEYLYHIDRMMQQLKRSGKLERLAGLVVGGFSAMKDNTIPFGKNAGQIILDAVSEYDYPVCFGFPAGHEDINMPFIHGKRAKLVVAREGARLFYQ